ncbi:TetR/AcrR family transcriptional regulator [Marinicrinis sediminis]|uniref:TetR/AcrR family transcriptional regulator n=1 Tax=Marinicrinis sediminis TaxID=1652465 RepID=A0ABW5R6S6_9BACL
MNMTPDASRENDNKEAASSTRNSIVSRSDEREPDDLAEWLQELSSQIDQNDKKTQKQLKILQSAIEVFAEKGYAASSTSEIAQRAGVAEGTIFRHYKTKKELLLSIVTPVMAKFIAPFVLRDFHKVLESRYETYGDFLRAILINRLAFAKKNLPMLKIMLQEIPFHPDLREEYKDIVSKQVVSKLTNAVVYYQQKGEIIDLPSSAVLRFTVGSIFGFLISRFILLPELDWHDEQEIEWTVQFITKGLKPE